MFKFKALEPHLTGLDSQPLLQASDVENKKPKRLYKGRRNGRERGNRLASVTWQLQAIKALGEPQRYRSTAIECEVRLAEALDQCKQGNNRSTPEENEKSNPNALSTAVCCQMLAELCDVCGPFREVLRRVHCGVIHAVYSNYYVSEGGSLQFEQIPYYTVVERLEAENAHLLQEKEEFREALLRREEDILAVEEQVTQLRKSILVAEEANRKLQQDVQKAASSEALAKIEAKAARDELKNLRRGNLKLQDEYNTLRALYDTVKDKAAPSTDDYEEKLSQLEAALLESSAQAGAAAIAANATVHALQADVEASQSRVRELEIEVQTLETDAEQQGRHMLSQAQRLEAAQAKWRSASAASESVQAQLSIARALLPADPAPLSWNVVTFHEQLKAKSGQVSGALASEGVRVLGAGLSASTPRFLRWNTPLTVTPPTPEAMEGVCHDILIAHSRTHMQNGVSCMLASTIFESFTADASAGRSRFPSEQHHPGSVPPSLDRSLADTLPSLRTSQQGLLPSPASTSGAADTHSKDNMAPTDRHGTLAQMGYTLMWGLQAWADSSPEVLLFREILQGTLGQIVWSRSRQLLQALNTALLALGRGSLDVCMPRSEVQTLLIKLLPKMPQQGFSRFWPQGAEDVVLKDLAASYRDGVPLAATAMCAHVLSSFVSASIAHVAAVRECVSDLATNGEALVEFEPFQRALLHPIPISTAQALEVAWATASQLEGQCTERGPLQAASMICILTDFGLPAMSDFWNLQGALAYCDTLHMRSGGALSHGGLPSGA